MSDERDRNESGESKVVERPQRTGGQAEGEPEVHEQGDTDTPIERKKPSQAEG